MDALFSLWNLTTVVLHDIPIPGSPERCVERRVGEDIDGNLWLLERLAPRQRERREIMGRNLERLLGAGMQDLAPYRRTDEGLFTLEHDGFPWQLSRFLQGTPLPQPDFIDDPERGLSLARLLVGLHTAAAGLDMEDAQPGLALPPYIAGLNATIAARHPNIRARLQPILTSIAPLLEAYADLPTVFCHGDFHPLNVIWQGHRAHGIIDWEFCGYRPDLFDIANLMGCVGIEDPQALTRGLVPAFMDTLREAGLLRADNLPWLLPMLMAQRWAWLSEWLRKNDQDMVALELDYLDLLRAHQTDIERAWGF